MKTHPLKTWRKSNGIRQCEFAEKIGVSRWMINRIENGARFPSRKAMARIIEATGGEIKVAELFGVNDTKPPG